ncbi:LamG-like jellyroll fold domain-containing protein [Streptomyces bacillaris]|uniref:LamG-like jellyroll fold domain-containing protein n=1 Tax=Streptomyces bacillaris TaxID=68179 RepID=UPI003467788D
MAILPAGRDGTAATPATGDAPEQRWGSARGRSHSSATEATEASVKGGRAGALTAPGQLPAETPPPATDLGGTPEVPKPGPVVETSVPDPSQVTGYDAEDSREVPSERKERERTFRNPDGTFTTRFYTEPVNFRGPKGDWKSIDTNLVRRETQGPRTMSGDDQEDWHTRSTESPVSFAATADGDPVVSIGLPGGNTVGYAVADAAASPGRADGSVITYSDLRKDSDLEFIASADSVKETIVLKSKEAPTEWRFPLALTGLTAHVADHGGVVFTDAAGKQQAWTPAGWMQDSDFAENANEGTISSGVTYGIESSGGRQVLVVSLDKNWLAAPERVYPVRVDPSVKSIDATSGTYVQHPYNQNFSSDSVLKTGTYDGGTHKAAAFLRFNGVESTLKNAWVLDTRLNVYNTWSLSCTARPVTVHPVTSNWAESTTTKYPGPTTGASLASKSFAHGWRPSGTTTWSCGPAWEGIKLGEAGRKLVDDWTHGRKPNYGLALKASTTDSKGWKQFGSDDYPNGKPRLDITWTKYGAAYKVGALVTPMTATAEGVQKVTVTNQGQETWPKGGNYKLRYNLLDAAGKEITDSAKIRWTPMPSAVAPGGSVTLDAKIAPLTPGTYTVQWTMDDVGVSRFTSAGVPGPAVKISAVNVPPGIIKASPGSGAVMDSVTPTLWAQGKDVDHYPGALQYTFEVCEVAGSNLRKNCRTGTRSTAQQWTVPRGWLAWGRTYAWYPYVYDGQATSARPGPALFTTQVPQPAVTGFLGGEDGREFSPRQGNYSTAAVDAAIPTVGPELAVRREYNSLDPRTEVSFGAGWTSKWDMRLWDEAYDDTVLIMLGNGTRVRFGRNPDNTYTGPSGGALTLVREQGGNEYRGWVLREGAGNTYRFSGYSGKLMEVVDGLGRSQSLTYAQEGEGPLTQVKDDISGRTLRFTWSGSRVASVTTQGTGADAPTLTWAYTYDGNRLTKVCPPASATACTTYSYENGSLYRSVVLDESPVSYWRLGESEGGTGRSQVPSTSGPNEIVYGDIELGRPGMATGSTDTAAAFDGTASYAELPEGALSTSSFLSVELWFKTARPGVLLGFQGGELDGGQPDHWSPLAVGNDGKLRAQFEINGKSVTPMTSPGTVTDDRWHHVVLVGEGTSQRLYLDGNRIGSLSGPIDHYAKVNAYLGAGWSSPAWDGLSAGVRHFNGLIDEVAVYHHPLDEGTIGEHFAARAEAPRITKVTLPSGRVHAENVYDSASGRLSRTTDENGGDWQISDPSYSSASSSYERAITRSGPTGYWRLGERSGATAVSPLDESLNGDYDGVRLGSAGIFTDGDDTAATFTGESSLKVPVESVGTQKAMSIEMWFKTEDPGVLAAMQSTELDATPGGYRPVLTIGANGVLRGKFSHEATSLLSGKAVTDGKWHHVVLTGNEFAQALYIDGDLQGQTATGVPEFRHHHVYVGAGYSSPSWDGSAAGYRYFKGQLDEVAFYDKPLVPFHQTSGGQWAVAPAPNGSATTPELHFQARGARLSGSGDQYRGVTVADSPAAYWRLSETEGTTLRSQVGDASTAATYRPDTGTARSSKAGVTGIFGQGDNRSVRLGSGGHVQLPGGTFSGTTDLSVELWFRTTSHSAVLLGFQNTPIGQTPTSWRPALNIDGAGKLRGEFYLAAGTGATPIVSAQPVTDGKWHHAVLTGSGNTQSLYLDGTKVGSLAGAISDQARPYVYLGGGYGSSGWMGLPSNTYYFQGDLDEVAFYRRALTEDQVSGHYRAWSESADSGLASVVRVTDPLGHTTSTTYDAVRGQRVTSRTDARGGFTSYAYDTGGFLHTVTDPNGHSTVNGHDARGNVVSTTTCRDADSCWTSFRSYHLNAADPLDPRNDKLTAYRDQRSTDHRDDRYRVAYGYNAQGLPTSTTRPGGSSTTRTYTAGNEAAVGGGVVPAGLAASQRTPGGAVTSYRYYASGELAQVTAPSGLVTRFTYDGLGRKLTETQDAAGHPGGVTTTFGYDSGSRVVTETGPGVRNEITGVTHTARTTRAFDADGLLLSEAVEDLTGGDTKRTTTYHHDALGRNDSVTDAEGSTTTYGHDALGRVIRTTDAVGNVLTYAYSSTGEHTETVLKGWTGGPSGEPTDLVLQSNSYDPAGRAATSTDAMGNTTEYTYFDDGLPATTTARNITRPDGTKRDIVLESTVYDPAGHPVRTVGGGGRTTVEHTVDALGRTTRTVLDPGGLARVSTFDYDLDDRLTRQTRTVSADRTLTATSEYDTAGNPVKESLTDGTGSSTTTRSYDSRGLLLSTVAPRGTATGADPSAHTANNRYDALGRLVEQTAPPVRTERDGQVEPSVRPVSTTGYNTFGEPTHTRDPNGAVTRTETDRLGRAVAVTLPDYTPPGGQKITAVARTEYDGMGQVSSTTDPLGRTTRYTYDQLGNLATMVDPVAVTPSVQSLAENQFGSLNQASGNLDGAGVTRFTWTPTGLQLSATGPTGTRSEATYDELGRSTSSTLIERYPSTQNLVSRFTWDDAGNQTASVTPGGRTTTATFNAAGEPLTVTTPAGTTKFGYDGLGRTTETTDPTGRRSTTAYGALGNVVATADHGTGTTALRTASAEFDADGNRTALTTPTGDRTTYTYDAMGRLTKQVEPVTDTESVTLTFGYDALGNRTRTTDGRGNTTTYTFTPWGLPESTVEPATTAHPAAADRTWTSVYDAAGQETAQLLPGGVKREKTYDGMGRLIRETGTGAEAWTTARTFSYDLAGRITAAGTDDPLVQNTYTYNDRGLLLATGGHGGTNRYTYDSNGDMTQRSTDRNTSVYGYDSAGRTAWVWDEGTASDIWYEYDAAGRPLAEQYMVQANGSEEWTPTARRSYGYDDLGRLTADRITAPDGSGEKTSTEYSYDLSNRLVGKETRGTAGAAENSYRYDRSGRMTEWSRGSTSVDYGWDAAGNRVSAGGKAATFDERNRRLTDGNTQYTYTARGTVSTATEAGGTPRALTFDAFERKVTDGSSTFTYDSFDRVGEHSGTPFAYDGGSNNLTYDGTTNYSRTPRGSLLATSDGTDGQWALTDRHDDVVGQLAPDGTLTSSRAYDPYGKVTAAQGTNPALGFQSGWTDPDSGDVNMASRWYQPGTGGFASRDTWLLDPSPAARGNRYMYGDGGPLNGIDPTGHSIWDVLDWGASILKPRNPIGVFWSTWTAGHNSIGNGSCWVGFVDRCAGQRTADAIRRQADNIRNQPRSKPRSSPGRGGRATQPAQRGGNNSYYSGGNRGSNYSAGRGRSGGGYTTICNGRCGTPVKPPKPPIDQNPNNGLNPIPAPTLPPAVATWTSAIWAAGSAVTATVSAQTVLRKLALEVFAPVVIDSLELLKPTQADTSGGKNRGRTRDDEKCDDGPGYSLTGHAVYLPRERYFDTFENSYQCRAVGVYGMLDKTDYNPGRKAPGTNTNSSTQPPGMREIESQGATAANGHLIPAAAKGSGIDLRNLVAEYEKTNTPYLSSGVESDIRRAIKADKHVQISITPHYENSGSGIPTTIEYNYSIIEDSVIKHCVIRQNPTGGTVTGSASCPKRGAP